MYPELKHSIGIVIFSLVVLFAGSPSEPCGLLRLGACSTYPHSPIQHFSLVTFCMIHNFPHILALLFEHFFIIATDALHKSTTLEIMAHLFDQVDSNSTIKWQNDSDIRGSFSIISSCTITLALGVWSAVHLNLPGNPGNPFYAFFRRTAWIICSLLAPEMLVFVAWLQYNAARKLQSKVEETFKPRTSATVGTMS